MINEMTNDEIEGLLGLQDIEANLLKTRKNGLTLTDNQVSTLGKYNIDASKCGSTSELLYMIDQIDDTDDVIEQDESIATDEIIKTYDIISELKAKNITNTPLT